MTGDGIPFELPNLHKHCEEKSTHVAPTIELEIRNEVMMKVETILWQECGTEMLMKIETKKKQGMREEKNLRVEALILC